MKYLTDSDPCPLCGTTIKMVINPEGRDIHIYDCDICGRVKITDEALSILEEKHKHIVSGITRNQTIKGAKPIELYSGNVNSLISQADIPRTVTEKLDRILLYMNDKSEYPGDKIKLDPHIDFSIAYCKNVEEFSYLLNQLKYRKLVETRDDGYFILTPESWERVESILYKKIRSDQCFVAMWFNTELESAYTEGIEKAIVSAGYRPLRVDKLEHNNKICDAIISEIRRSAFLIADFTGQRGGVYFEAGFAMGLGIPVIWLCHEEHIKDAHFDTRQYNHILWKDSEELYNKLLNRINATVVQNKGNGN